MFWLIYVTMNIKNVLLWLECRHETSAPLINNVAISALFHSNSLINQLLPQIIHILRFVWQNRCPVF